jgi:hypothetical protein
MAIRMGQGIFRWDGFLGQPLGEVAPDCQRVSHLHHPPVYALLTQPFDNLRMVITALRSFTGAIVPLGIALAMQLAH